MNNDQQLVAWIAVIGLIIGIWLVYKPTLSAIIFGTAVSDNNIKGQIQEGILG